MRRFVLGLLAAIVLAAPALADGMGPAPRPPKVEHTPATFFAAEKTCKRTQSGFICSTPGIACVPKVWVCTE